MTVTYRSFQLDPDAPARSTQSVEQHLAAKYGRTLEQAREMNQRVTDLAAGVGPRLPPGEGAARRTRSTRTGCLHLADARGGAGRRSGRAAARRRTSRAARCVSDHAELTEFAVAAGLDRAEVGAVLAGDDFAEQVRADLALAGRFGISGVPFFVFDRTYGVSGAQETTVFSEVLERVWTDTQATAH